MHIARLERKRREEAAAASEDDNVFPVSPVALAEEERRFAIIKELLTAQALGTS